MKKILLLLSIFILIAVGIVGTLYWKNSQQENMLGQQVATSTISTTDQKVLAPTTKTDVLSVEGMSQYTDTSFGFSFWYPSRWTVESQETSGGYATGKLVKRWMIFDAKHKQLFELGGLQYDDNTIVIGLDGFPECMTTYSYEDGWKELSVGCGRLGKKVSYWQNNRDTMGNVPMLYAQDISSTYRYIVPLQAHSAKNAISVSSASDTLMNIAPFTRTIVPTGQNATPVSAEEQKKMIEEERVIYTHL